MAAHKIKIVNGKIVPITDTKSNLNSSLKSNLNLNLKSKDIKPLSDRSNIRNQDQIKEQGLCSHHYSFSFKVGDIKKEEQLLGFIGVVPLLEDICSLRDTIINIRDLLLSPYFENVKILNIEQNITSLVQAINDNPKISFSALNSDEQKATKDIEISLEQISKKFSINIPISLMDTSLDEEISRKLQDELTFVPQVGQTQGQNQSQGQSQGSQGSSLLEPSLDTLNLFFCVYKVDVIYKVLLCKRPRKVPKNIIFRANIDEKMWKKIKDNFSIGTINKRFLHPHFDNYQNGSHQNSSSSSSLELSFDTLIKEHLMNIITS